MKSQIYRNGGLKKGPDAIAIRDNLTVVDLHPHTRHC